MNKLRYDEVDELQSGLRHRTDLGKYVPHGETMLTEAAWCFWRDVMARMRRGEWADFITAIERRFEPRDEGFFIRAAFAAEQAKSKVAA